MPTRSFVTIRCANWCVTLLIHRWLQLPAMPRLATASICSPTGKRSNTLPAKTSIGALLPCSTVSRWSREPSAPGAVSCSCAPVAFAEETLAEDADLTLAFLRLGYKIDYE